MSFNPEYFFPTLITNITQLNGSQFGVVKGTDIYPAVDVTDVTQSPTGTTKPYQIIELLNFIFNIFGFVVYFPVIASTTANLTATYNNGISGVGATLTNSGTQAAFTIDGLTGVQNDAYLVQFQSSPEQNGIYILTNTGSATTNYMLTRAIYFNSSFNIINNGLTYVLYGNTYAATMWQDTFTSPLIVGTTAINYTEWTFLESISILNNAGNPNGLVAGLLYQLCWDTTNLILYICTTAGNAASAVWKKTITLTAGTGITISQAGSNITISAVGEGVTWNTISGTSASMVTDNGYIASNAGLVTLTLPTTASVGDALYILGNGAGGWSIAQNSGQQIQVGNVATTAGAGGSLSSTNRYDSIHLVCKVADTVWQAAEAPQSAGLTIV